MSVPKVKRTKKNKPESDYVVLMPDVIPFGKFKGRSFDDVFYSGALHFQWLLEQEWLRDELKENIQRYMSDMRLKDLLNEYEDKKKNRLAIIAKAKENAEKLEQQDAKESKNKKK